MLFEIKLLKNSDEINRLYNFIKQFPLDYPDYGLWLKKCKRELEIGYKKAYTAIDIDNNKILGSIIFQPHKKEKSILEIKNLRVDPNFTGKNIGSILQTMVEFYASQHNFKRIQGDVHSNNPTLEFLISQGLKVEAEETLYSKTTEVILYKDLNKD